MWLFNLSVVESKSLLSSGGVDRIEFSNLSALIGRNLICSCRTLTGTKGFRAFRRSKSSDLRNSTKLFWHLSLNSFKIVETLETSFFTRRMFS